MNDAHAADPLPLVAALADTLADTRAHLDARERHLADHVLHDPRVHAVWRAELDVGFAPAFAAQVAAIDAARRANPLAEPTLLSTCRTTLHDTMMLAPFIHRTFTKPRGYAGDAEMMRHLYDLRFEGDTLFGRALHYAVTGLPCGRAVDSRKDLLRATLRARTAHPIRILSVASGPAQELWELFDEEPAPLDVVLLDQDAEAMRFATERLSEGVAAAGGRLTPEVASIRRLLADPAFVASLGTFDFIYTAGLYDYLRTPTAVSLTRVLAGCLRPGAELWIGNLVPTQPTRWLMEHHMDWHLIYRTEAELLAIAEEAVPELPACVGAERLGWNLFLKLLLPG